MGLLQLFFNLVNRTLVLRTVVRAVYSYEKDGHRQYIAYVLFYIRLTYWKVTTLSAGLFKIKT